MGCCNSSLLSTSSAGPVGDYLYSKAPGLNLLKSELLQSAAAAFSAHFPLMFLFHSLAFEGLGCSCVGIA